MNQASDAAEQIVKMSLGTAEVAIKLTGEGAIKLAALIAAALREPKKTKGKTRLINLLKSEKPLKVFSLSDRDLKQFCIEAKRYGVLYCVLKDKNAADGLVDIMVKADDAAKINRIFERINTAGINTADLQSEIQREQQKENSQGSPQAQPQRKEESFLDLLMSKASNAEEPEIANPTKGQMPRSSPSVTTSEISNDFERGTEHRPSVRELMKQIRKDLDAGRITKRKEPARTAQSPDLHPETQKPRKPIIKFQKEKSL